MREPNLIRGICFLILNFLGSSLFAEQQLKVLLVPLDTSIRPHARLTFDLYIYNTGKTPVRVPSLDIISVFSETRSGVDGLADARTVTHPSPPHLLKGNAVESKRIVAEVLTVPAQLITVHAEIGDPTFRLRSNEVLLSVTR
jgi:hypothetical protein